MKILFTLGLCVAAVFGQPVVTTVAGAGGLGTGPMQLHYPCGVAFDAQDNLYLTDSYNHRVLKVTPDGITTVILGTGVPGQSERQLNYPRTLAVDRLGNVYVTDSYNHRIQKVTPDGTVTTIAGRGGQGSDLTQLSYPRGIAVDDNLNVYVSDNYNHRVLKVTPEGIITYAAGGRGQGSAPDQLNFPFGIAVDKAGALYIGDAYNSRVQKVLPDGTATTVAGSGGTGSGPNQLSNPVGVDVDPAGNLYISDTNNSRIQRISPSGAVATIAGGLGEGAGERQVNQPFDTAVDSQGNLFIADTFNDRVLRYTLPAPLTAPQLRNAATSQPAPGSPNELMRISPAVSCPEALSVVVGGYTADSRLSGGETVFAIPEAVDPGQPTEVYVTCQSRTILPVIKLQMASMQPRLFASFTSQLLAEAADTGAVIDAKSPIKAGSLISLYGTGFGALDVADALGRRRIMANVTATIGGLTAEVLYTGTAPGQSLGLTQINLRVPPELKPGLQTVTLFVDGFPTQGGVLLAVQ